MESALYRRQFRKSHAPLKALAAAMALFLSCVPASAADPAETFVQSRIESARAILKDGSLAEGQRQEQFREFMLSITDAKRIARFTIGISANDAPEKDVSRFVAAFTEYSVSFYRRVFEDHAGKTIRVTGGSRRSPDDAVVNAEVVEPNGKSPPLRIAFRVRTNERGECVITDLQFEGAWLALTQRAEFTSYLQQHRGQLGQLSQELERRTDANRSHIAKNEAQS